MPQWPFILVLHLALHAAGDHRASRVMRAQRDDLGGLQSAGTVISDAEETTVDSEGMVESLNSSSLSGLQCSDMPSGFCCGLSPKKVRIDAGDDNCACGGPEGSGKFATQDDIDKYCKEVIQPCKQLSHVVCCDMLPKMIRHHDGKDQCWCSGPQPNSTYTTQADIDDWCAAVIKPCSSVSEGHCCHMYPKQIRQGTEEKCRCSGPSLGTKFPSQAHIDQACSKIVKPCSETSRATCCSRSPKQIRYNNGRDGCWCSGPVVGETYSTQIQIDQWCSRVSTITTSTTTATPKTTTVPSTTMHADVDCDEVSEAMCCALAPKRALVRQAADRCFCAGPDSSSLKFKTQDAIDDMCATVVRSCTSFRQEDCCQMVPRRYLVGDERGVQTAVGAGTTKMCTCASPQKGSRYTEQQAIDQACSRFFTPCRELQEASCCLASPAQFREGSGDHCFCSGPSQVGTFKTQQGIDKKCEEEVKPCASLQAGTCCSKEPKQVRVTDGFGHCWCSGPFLNGNMSYSQEMIRSMCSSAKPQTLQMS